MKKFLFFVVFVFVCVAMSAQTFVPVKSYVKGRALMAYGVDGSYVSITAAQYLALKDNGVGDYKIVSYKGNDKDSSFKGVISNKEYTSELLQVDSTSIVENGIKVFFTNGKTYVAKSLLWADVLKGQSVDHTVIKSSFRDFERYEALEKAPVDFVENHGLRQTAVASKQNPLAKVTADLKSAFSSAKEKVEAKVDAFIEPKTEPKTKTYSYGNIKIIEE